MSIISRNAAWRLSLAASGLFVGYYVFRKAKAIYAAFTFSLEIDDGPDSESRRCIPPTDFAYMDAADQHNKSNQSTTCPLISNDEVLSSARDEGSLVHLFLSGCDVYLIGSAHVSKKSAELVYRASRALRPDTLVVELCIDREQILWREPKHKQEAMIDLEADGSHTLQEDTRRENEEEEEGRGQGGATNAFSTIIKSLRAGHNPFYSVLNSMYEEVESQLETTVGLEFIRARQALIDNLTHPAVDLEGLARDSSEAGGEAAGTSGVNIEESLGIAQASNDLPREDKEKDEEKEEKEGKEQEEGRVKEAPEALIGHGDPLSIEERLRRRTRFLYQTKWIRSSSGLLAFKKEDSKAEEGMARAYPYIDLKRGWPASDDKVERRLWPLEQTRVIFGDVQVGMTVKRCWGALSPFEKIRLLFGFFWNFLCEKIDEDLLESMMKEDMLKLLSKELGATFPRLAFPLIHERNVHLTGAVKAAAGLKPSASSLPSSSLPGGVADVAKDMEEVVEGAKGVRRRVVAVVGKGHLPGLVYALVNN